MEDSSTRELLVAAGITAVFIAGVLLFYGANGSNYTDQIIHFEAGDVNHSIMVETAITADEKEKGLMHRESMPESSGMVFIYEEEVQRSFWMKNTLIPLDIIFVGEDKVINSIEEADPEPNKSDSELSSYQGQAKYVIEVNQGYTEERNISEGDRVYFDRMDN